jgi:hypothetical protein
MLVHGEYCDKNSVSYTNVKIAVKFFSRALSHGFPGLSENEIRLAKRSLQTNYIIKRKCCRLLLFKYKTM